MQVSYVCLIHFVNKSSKFNIGLSEFVIVLFYCRLQSFLLLLLLIIIMSQTKHLFEVRGKSKNLYLLVTTQVCLILSVNKSFLFNISYFVIVLLMLCVGFFFSLRVA